MNILHATLQFHLNNYFFPLAFTVSLISLDVTGNEGESVMVCANISHNTSTFSFNVSMVEVPLTFMLVDPAVGKMS